MSEKVDQIALRTILQLGGALALLLGVKNTRSEMPAIIDIFKLPSGTANVAPVTSPPDETAIDAYSEIEEKVLEMLIPRAELGSRQNGANLRLTQTPIPKSQTVSIGWEQWSRVVEVPEGRTAVIRFSVRSLRFEKNGVDVGVIVRTPMVASHPGRSGGRIKSQPLDILDRSPRTTSFGPGTRTLRFQTVPKESETLTVEFK